ncbi:hypothetical protein [Natronobiforma cellulositropha]|uniref:hypothetical protein n=1 Tax=Natronobiforma cellulositropha TaxID=1679076 RepID=UPI0021D5F5E0|nr:hypothetical protein [Natronobiforma cellulositropha]
MEGRITREVDGSVCVEVTDADGRSHRVTFETDGWTVRRQEPEASPPDSSSDPSVRDERTAQARRFARYLLVRERGYPARAPRTLPEWVAVAAVTVASIPPASFEAQFGQFARQLRSAVDPAIEPVVDPPAVTVDGATVYRLSVHLEFADETTFEPISQAVATELRAADDFDALTVAVSRAIGASAPPGRALRLAVSGVSDIGVHYEGRTRDIVSDGDDPNSGQFPVRLEMNPDTAPIEAYEPLEGGLQQLLVLHLCCQARDRFLEMGVDLPPCLRILGPGIHRQTVASRRLECYGRLFDVEKPVDGYRLLDLERAFSV